MTDTEILIIGGDRPTASLFFDHAHWACRRRDLRSLVEPERATAIRDRSDYVEIETPNDGYSVRWCLLAVGHRQLNRPPWAEKLPPTTPINHVWDPEFDPREIDATARVGIIGGGITAAKLATTLAQPGREVRLFARSPLRVEPREASSDWVYFSRVMNFRPHHRIGPSALREHATAEQCRPTYSIGFSRLSKMGESNN